MELMLKGVIIGAIGTFGVDLWTIVLNQVISRPKPNWGLVGRWVGHLPQIFHADIAKASAVRQEMALGWLFHYGVGIVYGAVFALLAGHGWFDQPRFLPIWLFGLLTISAGWFLLFPGMGLGWALAKVPNPWGERTMGLVEHTVFALGMFVAASLI
jgi:hypothetical protein